MRDRKEKEVDQFKNKSDAIFAKGVLEKQMPEKQWGLFYEDGWWNVDEVVNVKPETCKRSGCDSPVYWHGLCNWHFNV